ncbi:hypothetical protein B0H13DRAFT_2280214 [Mycena leptocephala]|nr:hypothetical protein B0H13DRAFT_2280214 [Mycena leptocephala]
MASLSTIPQDIHYHLLTSLSDFKSLAAAVLSTRTLHNAFQSNRKARWLTLAQSQGLSTSTIQLLVRNADTIGELQGIMFGLLKDQHSVDSRALRRSLRAFPGFLLKKRVTHDLTVRPRPNPYASSPPRKICVYCLLQTPEARSAFLKRYPKIQILELSHFVSALWILVCVIRGRPLETDRDYFRAAMKAAGAYTDDNADFMGVWCDLMAIGALGTFPEGARTHDAVLDGENEHLVELLEREAASGGPRPAPSRKVTSTRVIFRMKRSVLMMRKEVGWGAEGGEARGSVWGLGLC